MSVLYMPTRIVAPCMDTLAGMSAIPIPKSPRTVPHPLKETLNRILRATFQKKKRPISHAVHAIASTNIVSVLVTGAHAFKRLCRPGHNIIHRECSVSDFLECLFGCHVILVGGGFSPTCYDSFVSTCILANYRPGIPATDSPLKPAFAANESAFSRTSCISQPLAPTNPRFLQLVLVAAQPVA